MQRTPCYYTIMRYERAISCDLQKMHYEHMGFENANIFKFMANQNSLKMGLI